MTEPNLMDRRAAQAMVATFLQMARSAELARWLQQSRERSLERRAEQTADMEDLVRIQRQLDAQQAQALMLEQATQRYRGQAKQLAQVTAAGLTLEDLEQMGVTDIIDRDELVRAIEEFQAGAGCAETAEPEASNPDESGS